MDKWCRDVIYDKQHNNEGHYHFYTLQHVCHILLPGLFEGLFFSYYCTTENYSKKKKFTKNLELALKKRERIFFVTSRKRCISHNIYMLVRIQNLLLPIASRQAIDKYSTCLNVFTCDSVTDESNTCMSVRIHEQKWKSELQLLMSVKREFLSAQERNSTLWRNGYFTTK